MTTVIERQEFGCGEGPYRLPNLIARRSKRFAIDKAAIDRLCAKGMAYR